MIYIIRNNQEYGPYEESNLLSYVNQGKVLRCDRAKDANTQEENTVAYFLKRAGLKVKVSHEGDLVSQLRKIGTELIIPKSSLLDKQWLSEKRLLILAVIGLFPTLLMMVPFGSFWVFYMIALYFSCIWGLFFYYLFKTAQVTAKITVSVFFLTQLFVFVLWDILGISNYNPFYKLVDLVFPLNMFGYIFGVGFTEELAKAIPLILICRRSKEPIIPQTLVYYGLMSGIAFGVFEGVQYQMQVNVKLDYTGAFFMNIARLTSLPFLHAIWCGIAGYFVAFANLYPRFRIGLFFLAIAVPSIFHGLYDTFCGGAIVVAILVTFVAVVLLMVYLKQGVNYQSKLSQ